MVQCTMVQCTIFITLWARYGLFCLFWLATNIFVRQHFKKAYGLQPILQEFQLNIMTEVFEEEYLLIPKCNLETLQHPESGFKVKQFHAFDLRFNVQLSPLF